MAILRKKQNLAAISRESQKYLRKNLWQNYFAARIIEEYIAQISEEIEGRVTRKLSREFSRTASRNLDAL